uniref:NADH-quinone oxidoreductase chain 15 n=1 Tax=Siphoviridae sp. ctETl1 TaxID=2826207 RepID=A0A8S5QT16_9CAUD|nr:MAG TPA: NADH-quinone oxidoreductase chain 15 [Siphoviridae sp. ctETl1]
MKNRDSNENIYRNMEKPYALLQVHIFFSVHT